MGEAFGAHLGRNPPEPIDLEVTELIRNGSVRPDARSHAYGIAREIVVSACRWGDYYEGARRRRAPKRIEKRYHVAGNAADLAAGLDQFLTSWTLDLSWHVADGGAPADDALSPRSVAELASLVKTTRDRLTAFSEACRAQAPLRGSPGDPWLIAFVWAMAIGWEDLTTLNASHKSDRFKTFLQQGLASVAPDWEPRWDSAIETATSRFRRDDGSWMRPGEDLDRRAPQ